MTEMLLRLFILLTIFPVWTILFLSFIVVIGGNIPTSVIAFIVTGEGGSWFWGKDWLEFTGNLWEWYCDRLGC